MIKESVNSSTKSAVRIVEYKRKCVLCNGTLCSIAKSLIGEGLMRPSYDLDSHSLAFSVLSEAITLLHYWAAAFRSLQRNMYFRGFIEKMLISF